MFGLFALPALAIYCYFVVAPFLQSFYYGLTDWNGMAPAMRFVGLDNFVKMGGDPNIVKALKNNLLFCAVGGVATFVIAMFNAIVLTQSKLREKRFYRIVFFFPNILSIAIVAVLWMFIFNPSFGILTAALNALGLGQHARIWLGDKATVVYALIVPWVWMSVGFYMVLFISAIESIPTSLFEAAEIDGANAVQKFNRITLPLLRETVRTALVFFFINAFSGVFTLVNVMTNGEPAGASEVLPNYMYKNAFLFNKFGYATAIGALIFAITMLFAAVALWLTKSKDVIEF